MKVYILIICTIFSVSVLHSQDKDLDKLYNKARNKYATGHFEEARDIYKKLLKKKPKDFIFNYELGMLFFHELNNKEASIPYFESAKQVMKDTTADLYNYLGQAYQHNLEYDKAIECYNTYSSIPPEEGVIRVSVKRYINECRKEQKQLEEIKNKRNNTKPTGKQVINIGPVVNSENDDLSPIKFNDNLIITSARTFDYMFDEYVRRSYRVKKEGKEYSKPESLIDIDYLKGMVVDPNWHQHITSTTIDNNMITVVYEKNIWIVKRKDKDWAEPHELHRRVNRSRNNAYAALSVKGDRMIVSLYDRKQEQFDLYQTAKNAEGEWKEPVKLNDNINTKHNEHYPAFSEDGYTLYFSSDRPGGKGKYDIYASKLGENNEWGVPKPLEPPVNSSGNDITFKKYDKNNKAYFSSDRKGGFGKYDIYEVIY